MEPGQLPVILMEKINKINAISRNGKRRYFSIFDNSIVADFIVHKTFDGKNKYQTIIESNSFIGSGTRLVAPVKIAKGSYIAAGSTVTKDTPGGGSLTIARSKQVTIAKWNNNSKSGKK